MTGELDTVIVAYGSRDTIRDCVRAASALPDVGEVVVVDHGSDGAGDVASSAGARVLFDPTNPGFGSGQNRGVEVTSACYLLLLNPDATPDADGVAAGVRALDADPTVAVVQGVIADRTTGRPERSRGRELGPIHLLGRAVAARRLLTWAPVRRLARHVPVFADHVDRVPEGPEVVESLAATCVLVRRSAFDAVGGFDESYFLYGEDLDLCRRLRCAGWKLLALPDRFASHEGGASSSTSTERELSWWRGTMRFSALWWSDVAWSIAVVAAMTAWVRLSVGEPRVAARAWRALVSEPVRDRRRGRRTTP